MNQGPTSSKVNKEEKYVLDYIQMNEILCNDALRIVNNINKITKRAERQYISQAELQSWFRVAVRVIMDSMDALLYIIKTFSRKTLALRENRKKAFIDKKEWKGIRLIFKEFAVAFNSTFEIKKDNENLQKYLDARTVRNRITHPKQLKDLDVSVDEYEIVTCVVVWIKSFFDQVIKSQNKSIRS